MLWKFGGIFDYHNDQALLALGDWDQGCYTSFHV